MPWSVDAVDHEQQMDTRTSNLHLLRDCLADLLATGDVTQTTAAVD